MEKRIHQLFPNPKVVDLLSFGKDFPKDAMMRQVSRFMKQVRLNHSESVKKGRERITKQDLDDMASEFDLSAEFVETFVNLLTIQEKRELVIS